MKAFLIISVIAYLTLTFGGGTAALIATIQLYTIWEREPPEILSAAIVNTAAIFAATTFIGVLDMFMTLWTLLKTREWEDEARKERLMEQEARKQERALDQEARQKERDENRMAREAEQQRQEKALEESRLERAAERERQEKARAAEQQRQEKALEESRLARAAEQQRWEREFQQREAETQARIQAIQAESQARLQVFEAERAAQTVALQESRVFQQQVLDQLAAERTQRDLMTARVLDLLENLAHRSNGSNGDHDHGDGNGNGDRPAADRPDPAGGQP